MDQFLLGLSVVCQGWRGTIFKCCVRGNAKKKEEKDGCVQLKLIFLYKNKNQNGWLKTWSLAWYLGTLSIWYIHYMASPHSNKGLICLTRAFAVKCCLNRVVHKKTNSYSFQNCLVASSCCMRSLKKLLLSGPRSHFSFQPHHKLPTPRLQYALMLLLSEERLFQKPVWIDTI